MKSKISSNHRPTPDPNPNPYHNLNPNPNPGHVQRSEMDSNTATMLAAKRKEWHRKQAEA